MDEHDRVRRPPQDILPFLTTEHFTLQTERSSASGDTHARLQLYMSVLTSSMIALALIAQVTDVGEAFGGFALVLLPTVYVFGLVTLGRMRQLWLAWFAASQGMNRIRHYYVEIAPETAPYFVMPTTDEPWTTLHGFGIGTGSMNPWEGLYTAPAAVAIVNSAFVLSFVALMLNGVRGFKQRITSAEVRFPPKTELDPPVDPQ